MSSDSIQMRHHRLINKQIFVSIILMLLTVQLTLFCNQDSLPFPPCVRTIYYCTSRVFAGQCLCTPSRSRLRVNRNGCLTSPSDFTNSSIYTIPLSAASNIVSLRLVVDLVDTLPHFFSYITGFRKYGGINAIQKRVLKCFCKVLAK